MICPGCVPCLIAAIVSLQKGRRVREQEAFCRCAAGARLTSFFLNVGEFNPKDVEQDLLRLLADTSAGTAQRKLNKAWS